jgi:flagellar protein FliO/FliZ
MPQLQVILGENGAKFAIWASIGLAALIAVLLLVLVLRRLFGANFNMSGSADRRNRPPRLGVTDFFNLDRQGRRLVIVRRDNVEHLVLIGGPNDVLIEKNIIRGMRPELPIVETSTRPTVVSKTSDEANTDNAMRTEHIEPRIRNTVAEIPATPVQPAPKLNIPKLNIPNLDLRASTPANSTPAILSPAILSPAILSPAIIAPAAIIPAPSAPVQKPAPAAIEPAKTITPIAEAKEQAIKPVIMHETHIQKPVELKEPAHIPTQTMQIPVAQIPVAQETPSPIITAPKKPLLSSFGDAAKRLEEALRRPIDASPPKSAELKVETPRPVASSVPQKPVEEKKPEPAPATVPEVKPAPAATAPTPAPAAQTAKVENPSPPMDNLVLDLEQEMARLLGRTPGKGL